MKNQPSCLLFQQPYEIPFVILMTGFNVEKFCLRALESVACQNYSNYHIIFVDDCSTDRTYQLVTDFLKEKGLEAKSTVIKNKKRVKGLANIHMASHLCNDYSVIVILDADDWLSGPDVLTELNTQYTRNNIWLTYGQYKRFFSAEMGKCEAVSKDCVEKNLFRETYMPDRRFLFSHLRSYYAFLFKMIKITDLKDENGNFYSSSSDMVTMFPMIELAGERHLFISKTLYIYNDKNPFSEKYVNRENQHHVADEIIKKEKYKRLSGASSDRIRRRLRSLHRSGFRGYSALIEGIKPQGENDQENTCMRAKL